MLLDKEDKKRFIEKLSFPSKNRSGKKKIIWFHASSVGEIKSVYTLIDKFITNNYLVLVTTNTYLSSVVVKKDFPKSVVHQYLPIDFIFFIKRFLNYWRPHTAVLIESELWPNLIYSTKKSKIPLCLLQARFSDKSIKRWGFLRGFYKDLMKKFDYIVAQSVLDKKKIYNNSNIIVDNVKNLKNSSPMLSFDKKEQKLLLSAMKKKLVVSALSTHAIEEEIILENFNKIIKKNKDVLLILQPRHPDRKNKIINKIKKFNLNFTQRSHNELQKKNTNVFLFDTFGETGLVISISDIIILGGTFIPKGGHNIIEAAQLKKCIISGPYYNNIQETVKMFKSKNALLIAKPSNLYKIIISLIDNKNNINILANNAKKITIELKENTDSLYNEIIKLK
ncbi:MAG: hypothetical protein CMP40_02690 [Rickettsiales bacterium]|nr:hypothetical protein [Rickettsiales bacterium]